MEIRKVTSLKLFFFSPLNLFPAAHKSRSENALGVG